MNPNYRMAAYMLLFHRPETIAAMRKNGVQVSSTDSMDKLIVAYTALVAKSKSFREEMASLGSKVVRGTRQGKNNFTGSENLFGFTGPDNYFGVDGATNTPPADPTLGSMSSNPSVTSSGSGGGYDWGGTAAKVFDADTIKNILNTGLGAFSTKLQSKADQQAAQNAIKLEQLKLQQQNAGGAPSGGSNPLPGAGNSTTIIAVVLAVLVIGGSILYFRKK